MEKKIIPALFYRIVDQFTVEFKLRINFLYSILKLHEL